jgi:copper(I)-binding protein
MREVEGGQIPIPAGETVILKQGGLHVMCIGKNAPLVAGTALDIVLEFANAGAITVSSTVVQPGDMSMNQGNASDLSSD